MIKIKDEEGLFRDEKSRGVINNNKNALLNAKKRQAAKMQDKDRIKCLEDKMCRIETLLLDLRDTIK